MDREIIDSEKALLGCCLLSQDALDKAILGGVQVDWFRDSMHARLWQSMVQATREGLSIDLPWAVDKIGNNFGTRLAQMVAEVSTLTNVMTYIEIMQQNYQKRQLSMLLNSIHQRLYGENPNYLIDSIIEQLTQLKRVDGRQHTQENDIRDLLSRPLEISTGYHLLDYMTLGFEPATFWVIGGDTSHGKSTLALNFVYTAAKQEQPVTYISTEMREDLFFSRLITMTTGIKRAMTGLEGGELEHALVKYKELAELPIEFLYTTCLSHIRLTIQKRKSKVYFIDHLQDLHPDTPIKDRREEVSYLARQLEELSKEYKVCIVCTSKFSRPKGETMPTIHRFKETGEIEYSADIAILLWYAYAACNMLDDEKMKKIQETGEDKILRLGVVKNRIHGHTGIIKLFFDRDKLLIKEISHDDEGVL